MFVVGFCRLGMVVGGAWVLGMGSWRSRRLWWEWFDCISMCRWGRKGGFSSFGS